VGLSRRDDLSAALEAVLVSREQDRAVFRELFGRYFKAPRGGGLADLLQQPHEGPATATDSASAPQRALDALDVAWQADADSKPDEQDEQEDEQVKADARFSASQRERWQHADFRSLDAWEYRRVESLAREIRWPLPEQPGRRTRAGSRGARVHWQRALHEAARLEGELLRLPRRQRRCEPLPLLILIDVSGSMERYTRLLMAFLHVATRSARRRDVFAIGTGLSDLSPAFRLADTDQMLFQAGRRIPDFAGGTRLGAALETLQREHARRLVGRRTVTLIITDGLDTGEPAELDAALAWLKRHTGRLLWLNPMLRFDGYEPLARGARVLHRQADAMLPVHNLDSLQSLAQSLQQLMRA
jgi:uncharacterized protein with von Willebrand factor type A (vWA) domain